LLARELRQRHDLDVEVWALVYDGDYESEFRAIGVPTKVLGFHPPGYEPHGVKLFPVPTGVLIRRDPLFGLRWVRRLRRVAYELKRNRVDVLLPFTTWPNVVAGLTYRFGGVRLCIWGERHSGGERVPGWERLAVRQYGRFAANSTAGVDFLVTEMRVARDRIAFVPNGVEEPRLDLNTDWRARLGLHEGQQLVSKLANLTSFKDHATLLHAWSVVQQQWNGKDRPVLALAGYFGDRYDECRRIVAEHGMEATVRFLGGVTDVAGLVHASDVAAFSSRQEGMPNGVLECMAAGVPVVATDLPGVRDALGHHAENVLVSPGDAADFARRLLAVLNDRGLQARLGHANRARIRAEFSVKRMAERHLRVIEESLPGRKEGLRHAPACRDDAASSAEMVH
jgi:glycosyltransferase involved in cell wall biosynthesis